MKQKIAIDIDEKLLTQAMTLSGAATKSAATEMALQAFVARQKRGNMKLPFGKGKWEGDLNNMRTHY